VAEGDVTEGPLGSAVIGAPPPPPPPPPPAVIGPSATSWSPSPLHGEEKADGVTADG